MVVDDFSAATISSSSSSNSAMPTSSNSPIQIHQSIPLIDQLIISTVAKGGVATPFPYRLHIMLDTMDSEASSKGNTRGKSIVGWQPHGRAFKVHDVKKFVDNIMPHFFSHTKYASFQRQLNLYGFMRLTVGPDKGAVYHPYFVRNQPHLVQGMVRKRVKGTKIRKAINPELQPNFYADEKLRAIAAIDAAFDSAVLQQEETKKEEVLVSTRSKPTEPVRPIKKQYFTIEPLEKKASPLMEPKTVSLELIHPLNNKPFSLMHFNHYNNNATNFSP